MPLQLSAFYCTVPALSGVLATGKNALMGYGDESANEKVVGSGVQSLLTLAAKSSPQQGASQRFCAPTNYP